VRTYFPITHFLEVVSLASGFSRNLSTPNISLESSLDSIIQYWFTSSSSTGIVAITGEPFLSYA